MLVQLYISDKKIAEFFKTKGYKTKIDVEYDSVKEHHNQITLVSKDVAKVQIDGLWYTLENAAKLFLADILIEFIKPKN